MSGAVTKTNKHNTNKEDIPNSSHLPFIGTADTGDSSAGYLLEICLLFLNPQLKTTPLGYVYMWLLRRDGPEAMDTLQQTASTQQ